MNSLAVDTGGFVVRNTNIFDQALERIAADAGNYYVLGYRSDRAPDSKFRKLTVKVSRPGIVVRARRGYIATPRVEPSLTATHAAETPAPAKSAAAGEAAATPPSAAVAGANPPDRVSPTPAAEAAGDVAHPDATASTVGMRLRPDSLRHTNELASIGGSSDAAAAAGWEAYQRGDLEGARAQLTTAAAAPGAPVGALRARGVPVPLRDWPGAISSWEQVRAASPDFEAVYFDLVLDGYLQTRDYDKATRVLRAAAATRWPSDHGKYWSALGVVQVQRGALGDAVKCLRAGDRAGVPTTRPGTSILAETLRAQVPERPALCPADRYLGRKRSGQTERDRELQTLSRDRRTVRELRARRALAARMAVTPVIYRASRECLSPSPPPARWRPSR